MDTTTDIDPVELESKGNVLEFAKRYANLLIEQKKIKEDMKALCQEYEELGVPTKIAIRLSTSKRSSRNVVATRLRKSSCLWSGWHHHRSLMIASVSWWPSNEAGFTFIWRHQRRHFITG